ncbi:MAG TPA: GIDE domain-containing protein [Candidatus Baltobacteraceae bacterium]|nr:GIDE domain-containing protein [Candidatus Baltobacteraceae bacterium]
MLVLSSCVLTVATIAVIDLRLAFWSMVGAVAGVVLFYRGFKMLQFKRLVLNTPSSKIRSASMGLVEVSGMAAGPRTVPAGITGTPCFYYCATAWELKQSGNSRQWKKVAEETLFVRFFVDDSTGRLLVNPQGAQLDVHRTFRDEFNQSLFDGRSGRDLFPENVRQFLLRNGIGASGNMRLEEHCIRPGYPLFILGTLAENTDRGGGAPEPQAHVTLPSSSIRARSRSLFFPRNANELLQAMTGVATTALDGSGTQIPMAGAANSSAGRVAAGAVTAGSGTWASVSMDEMAAPLTGVSSGTPAHAPAAPAPALHSATAVAERPEPVQAPAQPNEDNGFPVCPPVVLSKGPGKDPFTISSESQRDVVRLLAWKSTACIWGGPALTLVCFYILSQIFGW